jgi:hypothetical protein
VAYKILGQVQPASTSNVDLYAVPSGAQAVISTLQLNNTGSVSSRVTIFARKFAGTLAPASASNALATEILVSPGQPISLTVGITLAESDVITVQSEIANLVTVHAFGSEIE